MLTPDMKSEADLIDAADKAVYLAKEKKDLVWPGINGARVNPTVDAHETG